MRFKTKDEGHGTLKLQLRIFPSSEQIETINKHFGHNRYVWNWAVNYNKNLYKTEKKNVLSYNLVKLLPYIKEEHSFLKEVDSTSLQQTLFDYSQSMVMFFERQGGHPHYRKKTQNPDISCCKC